MANPFRVIKRKAPSMSRPANQSAGILDDHAVRKNVATKEGSIEHVPTDDNHITNKKYVDDTIETELIPYAKLDGTNMPFTGDVIVNSDVGINTASPDAKLQVVGDVKIGDDNTNYASFATDGELTLTGTARVYKNQWINVQGLKAPGTKPASAIDWGISCAWEFSDGTDDTVCSSIRIPQDADRTVAAELKIGFASATNTGDVVWQLEYLFLAPGEDTTAAAQETLTTTTTISGTANGLTIATITGIDLPSSTDQLMKMRIKRLGADGDDTLSDDVAVVGLGIKYVSDKLGIAL